MVLKINEYISIRYEYGKIQIYVGEEIIGHCSLVLMNIPADNLQNLENFETMDELIEFYENHRFDRQPKITPEQEIWAHSSTFQAWVESEYDTRLLDMRLAFPILKELSILGDNLAREKFKDEIFKRFSSGYPSVVQLPYKRKIFRFFTRRRDIYYGSINQYKRN